MFTVHMGYSDVFNCLSLIDFYREQYDEVIFVATPIHKKHVDYYIRNKTGVSAVYGEANEHIAAQIAVNEKIDNLSIGFHDCTRSDCFKDSFSNAFHKTKKDEHFAKLFYTLYDIPYDVKIDYFNLERDSFLEDKIYDDFVDIINSHKYVIYHSGDEDNIKQVMSRNDNYSYINVNGKVNNIFSFIKVLEQSKELHLVDSAWASVVYLLDAKYGVFKDKEIFLYPYPTRSGGLIKDINVNILQSPKSLNNWKIIK